MRLGIIDNSGLFWMTAMGRFLELNYYGFVELCSFGILKELKDEGEYEVVKRVKSEVLPYRDVRLDE